MLKQLTKKNKSVSDEGWQRLSVGQAMGNSLESCVMNLESCSTYNLILTTYYFFHFLLLKLADRSA